MGWEGPNGMAGERNNQRATEKTRLLQYRVRQGVGLNGCREARHCRHGRVVPRSLSEQLDGRQSLLDSTMTITDILIMPNVDILDVARLRGHALFDAST